MVHDLLTRTESELAGMAVAGFAHAGPGLTQLAALAALAGDLSAAGLGKLSDRLRAVGDAPDERARLAAWAAAWTGVGLVRTRLINPASLDIQGGLALPHAPAVLFSWPLASPVPAEGTEGEPDELLAALQCAQPLARAYAAGRLAALGDKVVPHLLAVQRQAGRCIRFLVVETLGRMGADAALAGLVGLLGDGDVARPVEAALLALGERTVGPLAGALAQATYKDNPRRQAIAKLLWRLRAGESLRYWLSDGDELVAAYARTALWPAERLVERARQRAIAGLPVAADLPAMVALFELRRLAFDDMVKLIDALPKNHLLDAAAVVRHTGAEPPLLAHYLAQMTAGRKKKAREKAADFVADLASPAALAALLRLVEADSSLPAAGALAELADPAAVGPLIRAAQSLTQPPHFWRIPWIAALGRVGDPAAAPALAEMLNDLDVWGSRDAIERALVALGAPAVEAIGQALLASNPAPVTAAALERVLMKIETPQAHVALAAYRAGTSELTRLISHLAAGRAAEALVEQAAALGAEAVEPLLGLLAGGLAEGRLNAIRALTRLAPTLADEQREQVAGALRAELRTQQSKARSPGYGWLYDPQVEQLVGALCDLDVSAAVPEISAALAFHGVDRILAESWEQTRHPWLLDIVVQGIQAASVRYYALNVACRMPLDDTTRPRLWPLVEAIVQTETDAQLLQGAIFCLLGWDDAQALPLLQALKNRLTVVTGNIWDRDNLKRHLEATMAVLEKKRSPSGQ